MDELKAQILELVKEACQHPKGSCERQKKLNQIIFLIQQSGRLLRSGVPDAEDALQKTWIYFCQNLCEATTARNPYNPERGCVISWLNAYLYFRLKEIYRENERDRNRRIIPISGENGEEIDPVDFIPAPLKRSPILEEVREWLTEKTQELRLIHLRDRPDINCQVLIERRLFQDITWKYLSQEFGEPIPSLSGFYQRNCRPLLEDFGREQGYLD